MPPVRELELLIALMKSLLAMLRATMQLTITGKDVTGCMVISQLFLSALHTEMNVDTRWRTGTLG